MPQIYTADFDELCNALEHMITQVTRQSLCVSELANLEPTHNGEHELHISNWKLVDPIQSQSLIPIVIQMGLVVVAL